MCNELSTNIRDFAYIPKAWYGMLDYLEKIVIKENWNFKNVRKRQIIPTYT